MNPTYSGLGRLTGAGVNSSYLNPSSPVTPAVGPIAQSGHGGLDWIPTLVGTLGGIGAGALGTAAAPGIGTAIGAIGGFGAGQAGGQRIEDMLTGHQTTGGELLASGATGAATGAIGGLVGKGATAVGGKLLSKSPAAQAALSKLGSSKAAQTLLSPVDFKAGLSTLNSPLTLPSLGQKGSMGAISGSPTSEDIAGFNSANDFIKARPDIAEFMGNQGMKDMYNEAVASGGRGGNQAAIEAAAKGGDYNKVTQLVKALPEGDPYKSSMAQTFANKAPGLAGLAKTAVPEQLNTNMAARVYAQQNGLPVPQGAPLEGSASGKGAMDLFSNLKGGTPAANAAVQAPKAGISATLDRAAGRALADQYGTISKPLARATNPIKTFNDLSNAGLTKPQEVEAMAHAVTGGNGIINQAVVKAAGAADRVNIDGIDRIGTDAIENNGLVEGNAKSVQNILSAQTKILAGGPGGTLKTGANPSDVLQVMKNLEARISDLKGVGGNYKLTDPARLDQAKVLQMVHDELDDRLTTGLAGANANLPKVLTPQLREQLVNLAPNNLKWANFVDKNIMNATEIGQLRAAQRPFVNASKIIKEGDINAMTYGGRMSNSTTPTGAIGQLVSPVLRPLQLAASSAIAPVERATAAGLHGLSNLPNMVKGAAGAVGSALSVPETGLGAAGYQLGSLMARAPQQAPNQDIQGQTQMPSLAQQPDNAVTPGSEGGVNMEAPASPTSMLTPQLLEQLAMADIQATGGKNMAAISALGSLSKITNPPAPAPKPKSLSSTAATQLSNAQSGLDALNQMESEIQKNPNIPLTNQVGGVLGNLGRGVVGTQGYEAARKEAVDVLARMRTGAVINKSEEANFKAMLPAPYDSPQVAEQKLARYRSEFQNVISRISSNGSPTLEDALGSSGVSGLGALTAQ